MEKEVKRLMNMYCFISALTKGKLPQHSLRIIVLYSVREAGLQESLRMNMSPWMHLLLASVSKLAACQDCDCNHAPSFFGTFFVTE